MKHCRIDYDRIQDPAVGDPSLLSPGSTHIGEDEPVFLLRAKDVLAPSIVEDWARAAFSAGVDPNVCHRVMDWANEMRAWQAANDRKIPDTPIEQLRPIA